MTADRTPARATSLPLGSLETRLRASDLATIALVLLALLAGWAVKTAAESGTQTVTLGGVTAAVPSGWIIRAGDGTVALEAWNSSRPLERLAIAVYHGDQGIEGAIATMAAGHGEVLDGLSVIDSTSVTVAGESAIRIHYAFVERSSGATPVIVEGADYVLASRTPIISVTIRAPADQFAHADERVPQLIRNARAGPAR